MRPLILASSFLFLVLGGVVKAEEIYSLCKLEKGCIAGDEHFAKLIRQSIPNTNKRINRLKDLGYINTFIHTKNKKIIRLRNL